MKRWLTSGRGTRMLRAMFARRGHFRALMAYLVSASACAPDAGTLLLPDLRDAQAVIVATEGPPRTEVMSPQGVVRFALTEEVSSLALLAYRETPEALGLSIGAIEGALECLPCALATPDLTFEARVVDGHVEPWARLEAPPTWALDRVLPDRGMRCVSCIALEERPLSVPVDGAHGQGQVTALELDRDSAVVTQQDSGAFLRVLSTGSVEPLCVPDPGSLRPSAGYRAEGSFAWYSDIAGRLHKIDLAGLRPDRLCTAATATITPPIDGAPIVRMDGRADGDAIEVLALQRDGRAQRYSERGWTDLGVVPNVTAEWGVRWRGPGRAIFAAGSDVMLRVEPSGSELVQVDVGRGIPAIVTAVAEIEAFGTVLGTADRLLLFESRADWAPPPITVPPSQRVEALVGFRGGIAMSIRDGSLRLFQPSAYCEVQPILLGPNFEHLVALSDQSLLAAGPEIRLLGPRARCP